jgi:N-acetylglutamate synthase-like GNAT family acetyltransferase
MEIRRANPDDARPIMGLIEELGYSVTVESIWEKVAGIQDSVDDAVLLAVIDRQVVGCITMHAMPMFHIEGKLGRITAFVVTSKVRSQGVGAMLLASAHRWFESAGCSKFELTSGDQRTRAHQFYESHGYRRGGQRLSREAGQQ